MKVAVYETSSWTEIASMERGNRVHALCFPLDRNKLVVEGEKAAADGTE
jgi:hypothetical protein